MPNSSDRKIIERLTKDSALEMKRHELADLLESEVNKPAEEIDAQLVGELLAVLQPEEIPSGVQQKIWKNIKRRANPGPRKASRLLRRFAAAAAIAVVMFGLTIGAAHAFRWTFLLKLLQPVAETFGIYMNHPDESAQEAASDGRYTISEDESTTIIHGDLSEIPDAYDGYAIKPGWIPEGYAFVQATSFAEVNLIKYSMDYRRGTDELNIFVSVYPDPDEVISYHYERTVEEVTEKRIASRMVTFYGNTDENIQSVSWVDENLHYYISGNVTREEVESIVGSFLVRQEK